METIARCLTARKRKLDLSSKLRERSCFLACLKVGLEFSYWRVAIKKHFKLQGKAICPKGWDETSHLLWQKGNKLSAINSVISVINTYGPNKPVELALQVAYYLFLIGKPIVAAQILSLSREYYPNHKELLLNLGVCLSVSGQYDKAVNLWQHFLKSHPESYLAFDSLTNCYHKLGFDDKASYAGTRALMLKDLAHCSYSGNWSLPKTKLEKSNLLTQKNVIAFSLWGENPRYLRGAIDNLLSASTIYPGWILRFYLDDTVPMQIHNTLLTLGAEVNVEPPGQNNLERLAWRFKVANDLSVSRFLVRDVDSVINLREKLAVDEWISSNLYFHVMRDWWTHTDLILAGMWGGVSGVLPPLEQMLRRYKSSAMDTPNIDQWFLRDKVWAYIRGSCFVHDRCFSSLESKPWPGPEPEGNKHVGQDIFSTERESQAQRLADWLPKLESLHL